MSRYLALGLVVLTLMTAGCSRGVPMEPAVDEPKAPALDALPVAPAPEPINELDRLQEQLRQEAESGDPTTAGLVPRYGGQQLPARGGGVVLAEADLDGDGLAEVVLSPRDPHPADGPSALYVAYRRAGRWEVDRTPDAPVDHLPTTGVVLHGVRDLTGDGRPEIIWSSSMLTAHSPPSTVFVSHWEPGRFTNLPGSIGMINMSLTLEDSEIVLHGGAIGGGTSGFAQPIRTDRYRWVNGAFRLVDRTLATEESDGYFWLMQGIAAEDLGQTDRAAAAFHRVVEPDRPVLQHAFLQADDTPENRSRFEAAVLAFTRFRLGLLGPSEPAPAVGGPFVGLLDSLAEPTREARCTAASAWMAGNPGFEEALDSPFGYAHPHWTPKNLCGRLGEAYGYFIGPSRQ